MLFAIQARDKADSLALRLANRDAHLSYLKDAGTRIKLAGPLLSSGADPKPIGSLIVIDAASEGAVQLFANNDPYASAGLFESVTITPWKSVLGEWVPSAD